MQIVSDFFNKLKGEIGKKYFPTVSFYRDDKNYTKASYTIELFNNGCLTYTDLLKRLTKQCKADADDIKKIVDKFIETF